MFQQPNFFNLRKCTSYGGPENESKNTRRPLAIMRPTLVIFTAPKHNFFHSKRQVSFIKYWLSKKARDHHVEISQFVLLPTEIKLIIRGRTRAGVSNFFRTFAGTTAQKITKSTRGLPLEERFWKSVVFTHLMNWITAPMIASSILHHAASFACKLLTKNANLSFHRNTAPG